MKTIKEIIESYRELVKHSQFINHSRIEEFITQTLEQRDRELVEEIEKMKTKSVIPMGKVIKLTDVYNQAIDDIINLIKKELLKN